jgi:hypothetical protein
VNYYDARPLKDGSGYHYTCMTGVRMRKGAIPGHRLVSDAERGPLEERERSGGIPPRTGEVQRLREEIDRLLEFNVPTARLRDRIRERLAKIEEGGYSVLEMAYDLESALHVLSGIAGPCYENGCQAAQLEALGDERPGVMQEPEGGFHGLTRAEIEATLSASEGMADLPEEDI